MTLLMPVCESYCEENRCLEMASISHWLDVCLVFWVDWDILVGPVGGKDPDVPTADILLTRLYWLFSRDSRFGFCVTFFCFPFTLAKLDYLVVWYCLAVWDVPNFPAETALLLLWELTLIFPPYMLASGFVLYFGTLCLFISIDVEVRPSGTGGMSVSIILVFWVCLTFPCDL